jgi:hypothetical protein
MKNRTGKVYMNNMQAVTLPTELIKKLKEKGWKHAEEIIVIYHDDTDTLEVVPARKAVIEVKTPRGRLGVLKLLPINTQQSNPFN